MMRAAWRHNVNASRVVRARQTRPFHVIASLQNNSSIDANEISHFDGMASTWWDPQGSSRLLHLMNPMRHRFIADCIASQADPLGSKQLDYLDVGCGGGIFAESAARLAHARSVTGIDASGEVIAVAQAHSRRDIELRGKLRYLNIGIDDLLIPTVSEQSTGEQDGFDIVTVFEVLEHVTSPTAFLSAVGKHVKPGGWLVLSTIARTWTSWFTTKLMAEDVLRIVPRGTHDWGKYVNEAEIRRWFEQQQGWTGARAMGAVYVPTLGWKEVVGGEDWGNYFFAVRKTPVARIDE